MGPSPMHLPCRKASSVGAGEIEGSFAPHPPIRICLYVCMYSTYNLTDGISSSLPPEQQQPVRLRRFRGGLPSSFPLPPLLPLFACGAESNDEAAHEPRGPRDVYTLPSLTSLL